MIFRSGELFNIMPRLNRRITSLKQARERRLARLSVQEQAGKDPATLLQEALDKYTETRTKPFLLLLDVDGTIVNYRRSLSEPICPRPHLQSFFRSVAPHYDIVLFSRGAADHVETVRRLYCIKYVKIALSHAHWREPFKLPDLFAKLNPKTVILDDTREAISIPKSVEVIEITRWVRTHVCDRKLLNAAQTLVGLATKPTVKKA